jgi:hypothetical protein
MFKSNFRFTLKKHISEIEKSKITDLLSETKMVIFNFSYFFGNINSEQATRLAESINSLVESFPLANYFVLFQNSALINRNSSYNVFKRTLKKHKSILSKTEEVKYRNSEVSQYENREKVFYEFLEL